MVGFIFPSQMFSPKKPDEFYQDEYTAFKEAGYPVYLIDVDNLEDAKNIDTQGNQLIYRGWMLSESQYQLLNEKTNNSLLVDTQSYLRSHHLPNWYDSIKDLTFETVITDENKAEETFNNMGWSRAFIKDYVKSLKTGKGSVVDSAEDVKRALEDIHKYKGFVEGGIVFRKVMDFQTETETRFFVLNGKVFSNQPNEEMCKLVEEVAQRHDSLFYSVDLIRDKSGKLHVVEIGDGQVSDTVGWDLQKFIKIFNSLKRENKPKI